MGKIVGKTILDRLLTSPAIPFSPNRRARIPLLFRRHMPTPLMDHSVLLVARLRESLFVVARSCSISGEGCRARIGTKQNPPSAIFRPSMAFFALDFSILGWNYQALSSIYLDHLCQSKTCLSKLQKKS